LWFCAPSHLTRTFPLLVHDLSILTLSHMCSIKLFRSLTCIVSSDYWFFVFCFLFFVFCFFFCLFVGFCFLFLFCFVLVLTLVCFGCFVWCHTEHRSTIVLKSKNRNQNQKRRKQRGNYLLLSAHHSPNLAALFQIGYLILFLRLMILLFIPLKRLLQLISTGLDWVMLTLGILYLLSAHNNDNVCFFSVLFCSVLFFSFLSFLVFLVFLVFLFFLSFFSFFSFYPVFLIKKK
jgi:hypothetical protein